MIGDCRTGRVGWPVPIVKPVISLAAPKSSVVNGTAFRVAIVAARYNEELANGLLERVVAGLRAAGVKEKNLTVVRVPGSHEVPVAAALVAFIVFMERAQRRLLITYPKRQVGNKVYGGESSHLPLKLNVSGVIPPIFASSILLLPTTVASFNAQNLPSWLEVIVTYLSRGQPMYLVVYAALIIFFTFFYTSIVFNPEETAENLKKYGGFIPGIRPGQNTSDYLDRVLTRLTVLGAAYLCLVCIIPEILISQYGVPFYFGGTSLLIIVSVTMDTVAQVQSHLFAHQYEGLIKKARLGGRGQPRGR